MDKFKELLKSLGLDDETVEKVMQGLKDGKLYLSESEEDNLDIRYRELKKKYDALEAKQAAPPPAPPSPAPQPPAEPPQAKIPEADGPVADDGAKDAEIARLAAENARLQLENAVKFLLLENKATPASIDFLLFKIMQDPAVKIGEDGKVAGVDMDELKKVYVAHFEKDVKTRIEELKLPTPDGDPGGVSQEQFNKMAYTERVKLKKADPELYDKLAKGE